MHGRVNPFHRQICALDEPDLDRSAPVAVTVGRERSEALERRKCIGKVGLEDDACIKVPPLRRPQDPLKGVEGEFEVPVLLHVDVDKGRRMHRGRRVDQFGESVRDGVD